MQTLAEVWKQEGLQQGLQQAEEKAWQEVAEMVLRQLKRLLGQISARAEKQIRRLPLPMLEELGDSLLDFAKPADLTTWLRERNPGRRA